MSPWDLDQDWQDAPPAKKRSLRVEKEPAEPPLPPRRAPVERTSEPSATRSSSQPPHASKPQTSEPPQAAASAPLPSRREAPRPYATEVAAKPAPPPHLGPQDAIERDVSWSTLALLSVILFIFVFVVWVFMQDQSPASDEDLLQRPPVDQVAVIHTPEKLKRLLSVVVAPDNPALLTRVPQLWDTPSLSRFVQANGAALDNLRDLLEDPDWHASHAAWHVEDIASQPQWRLVLLLKQAEAAYLFRRMQEEQAFVAAVDLAEMGWRLEKIRAWPSYYALALESQARAAQTLADLLQHTKLSADLLHQFQRQYSAAQPDGALLEHAMNAFYVHEKKLILGAKSGENLDTMPGGAQLQRPGRLFFKPNETLLLFANAFRQLKLEARSPLAQTSEIRLKSAPGSEALLQPNAEGLAYLARRMQLYTRLPAQLGLTRTRATLVVTLFSIRRCIAEKKMLPTSLEQLQTLNYLEGVPQDPYSGEPLQYQPGRGLLWSVGNDLKNAGGSPTEPPMASATEPTVRLGIATAATVP